MNIPWEAARRDTCDRCRGTLLGDGRRSSCTDLADWTRFAGGAQTDLLSDPDSAAMFKIFVGNLDYKVRVEQLRELFSVFAPIEDLVIPVDPKTNRSKGFGIVMIRDAELGRAAVKAMQGKRLMGRTLVINEAVKKKAKEAPVNKVDLLRNGPFGPRMYRFGDPRGSGGSGGRSSRNPRRGSMGRPDGASGSGVGGSPPRSPSSQGSLGAPRPSPAPLPRPATPPPNPAETGGATLGPRAAGTTPASSSHGNPQSPPPAVPPARPKAQRLGQPRPPSGDEVPKPGQG